VRRILLFLSIDASEDNLTYVRSELVSTNKTARTNSTKALKLLGNLIRKAMNTESQEAWAHFVREFLVRNSNKDTHNKSDKHYLNSNLTKVSMLARQGLTNEELIDAIYPHGQHQQDCTSFTDECGVSLMTCHAAKNLEFKVVFIIDCNNKHFPYVHSKKYHDDPNDELKLFYVAITRCSEMLFMSSVVNRRVKPSRFIVNLDSVEDIVDICDIKKIR